MPAYYRARLREFVCAPQSEIEAKLERENAKAAFPLQPEALFAWEAQLVEFQNAAHWLMREVVDAGSWSILLEYPIPRVGKRIDAVVLARDVIIVIEAKTGAAPTSAVRQVDDYALNLACFHEESASRTIVPVVVSNALVAMRRERTTFDHLIEPCLFSGFRDIGSTVQQIVNSHQSKRPHFDNKRWIPRKMKTTADAHRHQFLMNAYRVRLTRARQGMVIYMPQPALSDKSRLAAELDRTAAFLIQCGAVELPSAALGENS
jgi:hypothetical protein